MRDQRTAHGGNGPAEEVPNLVDEKVFRLLLGLEVQKAVRLQYCVSVVLLGIDPAATAGGQEDAPSLAAHLATLMTRQLRTTDVVALLSPSSIGVLLIDAEARAVPPILSRAMGAWESHPLSFGGRDWQLNWSAGAGSYPQTATSMQGLLNQASALMTRARQEGGARLCLP